MRFWVLMWPARNIESFTRGKEDGRFNGNWGWGGVMQHGNPERSDCKPEHG